MHHGFMSGNVKAAISESYKEQLVKFEEFFQTKKSSKPSYHQILHH